jgi:hypothetical protein
MKLRSLPVLLITAALISAALTGCLQELPLGDKYINEAVGFLRVQNTSTAASYRFTGLELRNSAGEVIKTWEVAGEDGKGLKPGETWTGDLDREGSFILYCTVYNGDEEATGRYEYGTVSIKLREVTESKIMGETFLTDTDKDGFSDTWESYNGFDPVDPSDGGMVYVSVSQGNDQSGRGTAVNPYKSLSRGLLKAKYGLTDEARTVMAEGAFNRNTEEAYSSYTAVIPITDTGARGLTIVGTGTAPSIDAQASNSNMKKVIYLGPGTNLTIKNITIAGGYAFQGAGVHANGAALTLDSGAVIQRCSAMAGWLGGAGVYAENGGTVLMKSGSRIGGVVRNFGSSGVAAALTNGSSLTMEGGSSILGNQSLGGTAVAADLGSLVTLEDGAEIRSNTDEVENSASSQVVSHGVGVRLTGRSKLLMKGGRIVENTLKYRAGGAVYVGPESEMDMRGGEISGNKVWGNGGGVYVDSGAVFNMSGGEIRNNTAGDKGGGVYIAAGGKIFKTGGVVYGTTNSTHTNKMNGNAESNISDNALYIESASQKRRDATLSLPFTYP